MFNIRECAARQGGTTWITYEGQFRLDQGLSPRSWSLINNDLWLRYILATTTKTMFADDQIADSDIQVPTVKLVIPF